MLTIDLILCAVVVAVRVFLLIPIRVKGSSMLPTLTDGDCVLGTTIRCHAPNRFDIVICHYPNRRRRKFPKFRILFIKRVIAVPGDRVRVENGWLYINGIMLEEPYLTAQTAESQRNVRERVLGPDEYFVMGDNRNHSSDSRAVGPIKSKDIRAIVFTRFFPKPRRL